METTYRITFVIENADAGERLMLQAAQEAAETLAGLVGGDADEESVEVGPAESEGERADRMHGGAGHG